MLGSFTSTTNCHFNRIKQSAVHVSRKLSCPSSPLTLHLAHEIGWLGICWSNVSKIKSAIVAAGWSEWMALFNGLSLRLLVQGETKTNKWKPSDEKVQLERFFPLALHPKAWAGLFFVHRILFHFLKKKRKHFTYRSAQRRVLKTK